VAAEDDAAGTATAGPDGRGTDGDRTGVDPRAGLPADERALLEAFDRLRPQGTVRWSFDDAVRRLTEPPGVPGRSAPWGGLPGDLWERGRGAKASERVLGDVVTIVAQELAAYTDQAVEESRGLTDLSVAELQAWVEASLRPSYGRLQLGWVEILRDRYGERLALLASGGETAP